MNRRSAPESTRRAASRTLFSRPAPAFLLTLAFLIVATASVRAVLRARQDRVRSTTDGAAWIWLTRDVRSPAPLRFYAEREFSLVRVPSPARARLFVDRRWSLEVNGVRVGSGEQRAGDRLIAVDVGAALRPGINRFLVEAESPTGIGGILFALDLGDSRNAIVSDDRWRVSRSREALERGGGSKPWIWGRPPMYPWGYPAP